MQDIERQCKPSEGDKRISTFFSEIQRAPSRILFLGYEGTLEPACRYADRSSPYPQISPLLRDIRACTDTRLVIVTGRMVKEVSRLLDLTGVEVWGCHGLERSTANGGYEMFHVAAHHLQSIERAGELLLGEGLGDLVEFKPGGVAIHWEDREIISGHVMRKVLRVWSSLATSRTGLRLMPFDCGIELRVETRDKGDIVRTILSEAAKGAAMAYVGGDLTDEDAFGALHLRGLNILARDEPRSTLADVQIRALEGVAAFLADWIAACRSGG